MKELCYGILRKVEHMGWTSNPDIPDCLEHHLENGDATVRVSMAAVTVLKCRHRYGVGIYRDTIISMYEDAYLPELIYSLAVAWRNRELEKAYTSIYAYLETLN